MNFSPVVSDLTIPFYCGIQKLVMFLYPFSKLWLQGACCRLSHQSIFCEVLNDFEGFFWLPKTGGKGRMGSDLTISYVSSGLGLAPFTGATGGFFGGRAQRFFFRARGTRAPGVDDEHVTSFDLW